LTQFIKVLAVHGNFAWTALAGDGRRLQSLPRPFPQRGTVFGAVFAAAILLRR